MKKFFLVAPTGKGVGLTSVSVGLVRAFDQAGTRVAFCKPIAQHAENEQDQDPSLLFADVLLKTHSKKSIPIKKARQALINGELDDLMEDVVKLCHSAASEADVVIVEGLVPQDNMPFIVKLNSALATTLDSDVILVGAPNNLTDEDLNQQIKLSAKFFGGAKSNKVLGCIINKVGAPTELQRALITDEDLEIDDFESMTDNLDKLPVFQSDADLFRCLGKVTWNPALMAPRLLDVAKYMKLESLNEGGDFNRRVTNVTICARTLPNIIGSLKAGSLVVTPGDREDILLAVCLAELKGIPLAGLLLTGGYRPNDKIMNLCHSAIESGLPILITNDNTIRTAQNLDSVSGDVPHDDLPRIEKVMNAVAESLDIDWLVKHAAVHRSPHLSPAAFRYQLVQRSSAANKRIVLPEGEEPRTIQAAIVCHEKNIARCVLIGERVNIESTADSLSLTLPDDLEIIDPTQVASRYLEPLVEMRKHKGITEPIARSMLEDRVVLATMMLALDEVDGLVGGAIHTTANILRPALQLIKTQPGSKIVSSVFFMCLPEQVVVYGDCAVNPDPTAEELADIAIQSGDSAQAMGIEPRIAMISYSTGESGIGVDVDKVRKATSLAKEQRPDLIIDGPLQYDAASVAAVAAKKAPDSAVAGNATVFIFPDLNTGNTTYKAVQRSANVVSIGPMLQGLNKPVNDLSRGALVEDIVYTIALTAIQAHK